MERINTPNDLLAFMSENISYGYLGKNGRIYYQDNLDFDSDWQEQYVLESKHDLIKTLHGNCWDQVEFERNWFLEHNYEIKTIYEMVLLDYENSFPSHSFLAYKDKNDNWNWFENADGNNQGIHTFKTFEELLRYQYNCYLEFLEEFNISEEERQKIILTEFDKPKENISAKEYIEHVVTSKRIDISNQGRNK